ncbi:MAG: hypothetical protein HZB15_12380 [Actinobacteria bacterium]|nr:hypothetical protein [Actinomycetota bacterium]
MTEPTDTPDSSARADENHAERLDREHEQLFHELRSIIPGAEVLFAFLLTVAFSQKIDELTSLQRGVYYTTFMLAGSALIVLLGPSAFHRVQFRKSDKEAMMRLANVEAIVALVLISLSLVGAVFLITDRLFSTTWAIVAGAIFGVVASLLWWAVPLSRRAERD